MNRRALLSSFWMAVAALCAVACQSAEEKPASPAVAHAVDSEKLEVVMRQMVRMDSALLPPEMDLEAERRRQRAQIAQLAGAIEQSADGIPAILANVELPAEYRDEFVRLARELEDHARRLHEAAPGLSTAELKAEVAAMRESCTACHTRFRVLPVVR